MRWFAIDKILKGVTIVVVPSIWQEGFGLSVIEGMASGKAVIASNVGGIVEIIDDGENGYLFPAGDGQALALNIFGLVDDQPLRNRIGNAARRKVITNFNIQDKKRELLESFTRVCFDGTTTENRNTCAAPDTTQSDAHEPW